MGAEISKQLEEETQQQQQHQQQQRQQQKQLSQQQQEEPLQQQQHQHQPSQQQQQKQPLHQQQQEYHERRNGIKKLELKEAPSPSSVPQNLQRSVSNRENSKKQADQRPNYGSKSLSPHDDHHQKVEKVLLTNSSLPQNSPNRSSENYSKKAVIVKQASIPQNLQQILKDADSPIDTSSANNKLYEQLYSGVFLHHKTKKYWMDKKLNCNCFMLYARSLSITWGDTEMYWRWLSMEESSGSGTKTEVAELKAVCWLEVNGRLEIKKLSPGILYQVSFHVMLNEVAFGWEVPINLRLVLLGGGNNNNNKQEYKLNLRDKVRNVRSWTEIPVGKFVASSSPNDTEFLEFSLYEYEAGNWKQGLLIKGVSIKPAHSDHDFTIPL